MGNKGNNKPADSATDTATDKPVEGLEVLKNTVETYRKAETGNREIETAIAEVEATKTANLKLFKGKPLPQPLIDFMENEINTLKNSESYTDLQPLSVAVMEAFNGLTDTEKLEIVLKGSGNRTAGNSTSAGTGKRGCYGIDFHGNETFYETGKALAEAYGLEVGKASAYTVIKAAIKRAKKAGKNGVMYNNNTLVSYREVAETDTDTADTDTADTDTDTADTDTAGTVKESAEA